MLSWIAWTGTVLGAVVVLLAFAAGAAPYAVRVTATPPKTAKPGDTVTHVFTVHNVGERDDLYALELVVPEGWGFFPRPGTVAVGAGEAEYVFVNLTVPETAAAGAYTVSLRVVSQGNPSVSAEASTAVEVLPLRRFELAWVERPQRVQAGIEARGVFSVTNTGNVPDSYILEVETPTGWAAWLTPGEIHLLPGERGTVGVIIRPPRRAEPGRPYAILIRVTSAHEPTLERTLGLAGEILPPPPELVSVSVYPEWTLDVGTELNAEGDTRFSLRGSGDISPWDLHVDMEVEYSLTGHGELRAAWEGRNKSFYLQGGSISGSLLGVGGKPLFGGSIGNRTTWRALFTPTVKGIAASLGSEEELLGIVLGSDSSRGLSFSELTARRGFTGGIILWGSLSEGALEGKGGQALELGASVSRDDHQLEATWIGIGPDYPYHLPRTELELSWDSSYPVPFTASYFFSSLQTPAAPVFTHELTLDLALKHSLSPRWKFAFRRRSGGTGSVDEGRVRTSFSLKGESPLPWGLSLSADWEVDRVLSRTVFSLSTGGSIRKDFRLGRLSLEGSITSRVGGMVKVQGELSLRSRLDAVPGDPEIELRISQERTELSLSFADLPAGDGLAQGKFSYTLKEGRSSWKASFSLSFTAPFPLLGPTKGIVRGRVFIDKNRDFRFDPGDSPLEGVVLAADGALAVSGKGGVFVFPSLEPGDYHILLQEVPEGLAPEGALPVVHVEAGKEVFVSIPLRSRAWLKGLVFEDKDRDGILDPGEPGVSGVRVLIRGPVNRELITDPSGYFVAELPPGDYEVRLLVDTLPKRFSPTSPTAIRVTVPEYGVAEVHFGAYRKPRPVVVTFAPPQAAFTYFPPSPVVGEPVRFSGAKSRAVNARIVDYHWEFHLREKHFTAQGKEVTVVFPVPGTWEVILIVTDSKGLIAATKATVEVRPAG